MLTSASTPPKGVITLARARCEEDIIGFTTTSVAVATQTSSLEKRGEDEKKNFIFAFFCEIQGQSSFLAFHAEGLY